jgi:purine-binding chemotaxis protein CheW
MPVETGNNASGRNDSAIPAQSLAGKYMTFKLDQEEYGIGILSVREIIGMMDITRVPMADHFIRGVINLRGRVIPVVDLRLKFCMDAIQPTDQTVIIVVQFANEGKDTNIGVLVDEVVEVVDFPATQVEPPPSFESSTANTDFILGVGKIERRVIFLLDICKVLCAGGAQDFAAFAGD